MRGKDLLVLIPSLMFLLGSSTSAISEFYMVAMCHRSRMKSLFATSQKSFNRCKSLAYQYDGAAFNFSPPGKFYRRRLDNATHQQVESCMIFSCPEVENSTTLVIDTRFDYFSIYADPIPPINSSCIEGLGVFVIHTTAKNYTEAQDNCRDFGSSLPDVATKKRTNDISLLIDSVLPHYQTKLAYIGMDDIGRRDFIRSNGELLTATAFRAWAPGHPRRFIKERCGVLDAARMWRVVDCKKKLPYICEINPGGWYQDYQFHEEVLCYQ